MSPPEGLDGVGHWPELVQEEPLTRTELLYNYQDRAARAGRPGPATDGAPVAGLRWGRWKYLSSVAGFSGWQQPPEDQKAGGNDTRALSVPETTDHHYSLLFDLSVDPEERTNLASEEPQVAMDPSHHPTLRADGAGD